MYDPTRMAQAQTNVRYSVLARSDVDVATLGSWDPDTLREPRVLVPVDVRALVVAPGDTAVSVALPGPLSPGAPADASALTGPDPFATGSPRPPGVYLSWALPDALLRGTVQDPRGGPGGGLGMAALPDRWAVLRLLAAATPGGLPSGSPGPIVVTGWLIDAAAAVVRDLAAGPDGAPVALSAARRLDPAELTGAAGGSLTWTGQYDAAYARFAWNDPLTDLQADASLSGTLPGGPAGAAATYLVLGWWSTPGLDPLDGVRTEGGLAERLHELAWRLVPGDAAPRSAPGSLQRLAELGLPVRGRLDEIAPDGDPAAVSGTTATYQGVGATSLGGAAARVATGAGTDTEASTLLHGAVLGVPLPPVGGPIGLDLRPSAKSVTVLAGDHVDDLVVAALTAGTDAAPAQRRALERLLTAFSTGLLPRLGDPDGLVEIDEAEHTAAFVTVDPQEPPLIDRVRTGRASTPQARPAAATAPPDPTLRFTPDPGRPADYLTVEPVAATRAQRADPPAPASTPPAEPDSTTVSRPAPRRMLPLDPQVGLRGAGRFLGHGTDGSADPDGLLACRRGSQIATRYTGLLDAATLLPSLSSGAVPAEALALAQEALLLSPHLLTWLAGRATPQPAAGAEADPAVLSRLGTELGLRFDRTGAYLGKAAAGATLARGDLDGVRVSTLELLRRHSLLEGVEPDPVALTSWAQPWIPLALEWEAAVTPLTSLEGWTLGAVDLDPDPDPPPPGGQPVVVSGRSGLTTGPGAQLAGAITTWRAHEDARDAAGHGETDAGTEAALAALSTAAAGLDMLATSLDGIRRVLLGWPAVDVRLRADDGTVAAPAPVGPPALLAGGTVTLRRLRLVDAFGRTLDLDPATAISPARITIADRPGALSRTPRITAPARLRLRLVGAETVDPAAAADAVVDEVDPSRQVNPVVGFLLPNHVDEAVAVFGADGTPLGELLTGADGVAWEPAPGRPLRADAAPGERLTAAQRALGLFAAGLVAADATARATAQPSDESAVSAFLRAVDTTLWTIDPLAGAGSSAVASIVGRPVAVVRATVVLDVADDLAELSLTPADRIARAATYAQLSRLAVGVRVGELTRSDDGVLGWFADDDFTRMHVVDKAVRDLALPRSHDGGRFGPWPGDTPPAKPPWAPITHPYLDVARDLLVVRPGVPRLVTLLMMPGSAATLTCGLLPRTTVRLSRAWFAAGLETLSPSVRIGPALVDPGDVRLPTVSALGARQVLTHREGPLDWRDDAILAATQAALLPDRAHVLREGWIRVDPTPPPGKDAR